jgi:hypothetical protein
MPPSICSHALRNPQRGSLDVICAQIRKAIGTNKTYEKKKQSPRVTYVAIHSENVTNGPNVAHAFASARIHYECSFAT